MSNRNQLPVQPSLIAVSENTPPIFTPIDADVDIELLRTLPKQFAITDERSANWLVRKVIAARIYAQHVKSWADHELRRAAREEQTLLYLFGHQLESWAKDEIDKLDGKRKSLTLPAGTVGYRKVAAKLVVDDEAAVISWARENCKEAITLIEKLSKSLLDQHIQTSGSIPDEGTHFEPESERFYVK